MPRKLVGILSFVLVPFSMPGCGGDSTSPATISIAADSGTRQSAFRGTKLAEPIVVLVRDQTGAAIANRMVQFSTASGNGTVDSAVAFTDATGRARTGWTVGTEVGEDTALAAV
ncbi:MAG: hypothetical protein JSW51_04040, partial [Gemmatimonadota bacterium]